MKIQRVSSKWAKTKVILPNRQLAVYIPETRKYSLEALVELLGIYGTVYIKPDRGTFGSGVMRAEQRTVHLSPSDRQPGSSDRALTHGIVESEAVVEQKVMYILRYAKDAEAFSSPQELHAALLLRIKGRTYLIQQGIDLLCYQDRPFDLRVLTQKNLSGAWETTGMLGRVAAPQKVVTNYHSGGSIYTVRNLLKTHMIPDEMNAAIQQLKLMGEKIAAQLETAYPGLKEIGLDVAIDSHHDLWLLEVNTLPSIVIFGSFQNKSIYRKIRRYARAYGRLKKTRHTSVRRHKRAKRH
ncbi:YheC/YheD family protein [Paenibacillus sonchi]|uniref:YheC/YheD family protein n=1 Tax=Paenibacillus sonchi TaxID=373687 RepID=A0A974PFU9_9BACL|nr:YheC/YheD family protein [Paenibacillus sonchi]MCE3204175.1 YheC/YheD family protein [Paenibacillus sonchi]QQZ62628.1 YheC/YheD family protein [Paenibacillus sonchi]